MRYTVKISKAKMNKKFGELVAYEIQEMLVEDKTLSTVSQSALKALEAEGFATVATPGLGWKPLVYVHHQKMMDAGLIQSWDVKQ